MSIGVEDEQLGQMMKTHFGFDAFLQGQKAIIEDVLSGHPTIAVMPTGAGKSLCYQLPALLCNGPTVVVSPLISLMKDQVDGLRERGIEANFLNSSQTRAHQEDILRAIEPGQPCLLYVSPERFRDPRFNARLAELRVELMAIDEAHCISRWGHDFRPDYARLGNVVERVAPQRLIACTATATPQVKSDIIDVLGMASPRIHAAGFLRKNLFLRAHACHSEKERTQALRQFLSSYEETPGAVIIYASTRKRVSKYGQLVSEMFGRSHVVAYHGGLEDEARTTAQDAFMSGRARFAVATNAFGMGIDRPDVRAVVHIDLPRTIEGYYQEVGRAGRDGEPAHCLLLHHPKDLQTHSFLIEMANPNPELFSAVWNQLCEHSGTPRSVTLLVDNCPPGTHPGQVESVLRALHRADAAFPVGLDGEWQAHPAAPREVSELPLDFNAMAQRLRSELAKLEAMRTFAFRRHCRHQSLLDYFGEHTPVEDCPGCDRCTRASDVSDRELTDSELTIIRQALAGVARAKGSFGLKRVAGMLAGSTAKGVGDTPALTSLSTYGLLSTLGLEGCTLLLKAFVTEGLCELVGHRYPMLQINAEGWSVMQGRSTLSFTMPTAENSASSSSQQARAQRVTPTGDDPLTDCLRDFRREEARRRNAPAYVVFNDKTLAALVATPPKNREEFEAILGLGPGKWSSFGPALIETLQAHQLECEES